MAGKHFDTKAEALAHLTAEGFVAESYKGYTHKLDADDEYGVYTLRAVVVPVGGNTPVHLMVIDTQEQADEERG